MDHELELDPENSYISYLGEALANINESDNYETKSNELIDKMYTAFKGISEDDIDSINLLIDGLSSLENLLDYVEAEEDYLQKLNDSIRNSLSLISSYLSSKDKTLLSQILKNIVAIKNVNKEMISKGNLKISDKPRNDLIDSLMDDSSQDEIVLDTDLKEFISNLSEFDYSSLDKLYIDLYKALTKKNIKEISKARGRLIKQLKKHDKEIKGKKEEIQCLIDIRAILDSKISDNEKMQQIKALLGKNGNLKYKEYFYDTLESYAQFRKIYDQLCKAINYKKIVLYAGALKQELKEHKEILSKRYDTEFLDKKMNLKSFSTALPKALGLSVQEIANSINEVKESRTGRKKAAKVAETIKNVGKLIVTPGVYGVKLVADNWYTLYLLRKGKLNLNKKQPKVPEKAPEEEPDIIEQQPSDLETIINDDGIIGDAKQDAGELGDQSALNGEQQVVDGPPAEGQGTLNLVRTKPNLPDLHRPIRFVDEAEEMQGPYQNRFNRDGITAIMRGKPDLPDLKTPVQLDEPGGVEYQEAQTAAAGTPLGTEDLSMADQGVKEPNGGNDQPQEQEATFDLPDDQQTLKDLDTQKEEQIGNVEPIDDNPDLSDLGSEVDKPEEAENQENPEEAINVGEGITDLPSQDDLADDNGVEAQEGQLDIDDTIGENNDLPSQGDVAEQPVGTETQGDIGATDLEASGQGAVIEQPVGAETQGDIGAADLETPNQGAVIEQPVGTDLQDGLNDLNAELTGQDVAVEPPADTGSQEADGTLDTGDLNTELPSQEAVVEEPLDVKPQEEQIDSSENADLSKLGEPEIVPQPGPAPKIESTPGPVPEEIPEPVEGDTTVLGPQGTPAPTYSIGDKFTQQIIGTGISYDDSRVNDNMTYISYDIAGSDNHFVVGFDSSTGKYTYYIYDHSANLIDIQENCDVWSDSQIQNFVSNSTPPLVADTPQAQVPYSHGDLSGMDVELMSPSYYSDALRNNPLSDLIVTLSDDNGESCLLIKFSGGFYNITNIDTGEQLGEMTAEALDDYLSKIPNSAISLFDLHELPKIDLTPTYDNYPLWLMIL